MQKNDLPKFLDISQRLIDRIKKGELQPGDKIESENEIIAKYKVSNTTARKSLQDIESKGWVKRMKGKGTFVLNKTYDAHITRTLGSLDTTRRGFSENLKAEGFTPSNVVIEKTILKDGISSLINDTTVIIPGPVLLLKMLRYADDILLKYETKYISLTHCPKIDLVSEEKVFYKLYETQYKLEIDEIRQTFRVQIIDPKDKNYHFENQQPLPVFLIDSAIITRDQQVIEIEKSYYRGDKYQFALQSHPGINYGRMK